MSSRRAFCRTALSLHSFMNTLIHGGFGGGFGLSEMALKPGDYVITKDGMRGKVVHTSRMTVFVAFPREGREDIIGAFLESDLARVDAPEPPTENFSDRQ
jgi:hypothetical protein